MRFCPALALLLIAACAPKREEVAAEPVVVMEEPVAAGALDGGRCQPGDDDGIGGTGCQAD